MRWGSERLAQRVASHEASKGGGKRSSVVACRDMAGRVTRRRCLYDKGTLGFERIVMPETEHTGPAIGGPLHGRQLSSRFERIMIPIQIGIRIESHTTRLVWTIRIETGLTEFATRTYTWRSGRWVYDVED